MDDCRQALLDMGVPDDQAHSTLPQQMWTPVLAAAEKADLLTLMQTTSNFPRADMLRMGGHILESLFGSQHRPAPAELQSVLQYLASTGVWSMCMRLAQVLRRWTFQGSMAAAMCWQSD